MNKLGTQPTAPLFEEFSLDELTRRTGYSEVYLVALKAQPGRITPRFRDVVSRILGRSEAELFGGVTEAGDSDLSTNASKGQSGD